MGYARNTNQMLLVAIIPGPWLHAAGDILVVKNTVDVHYVVPIGIVVHGKLKTKREYLQCENIPPEPPELQRITRDIEHVLRGQQVAHQQSLDTLGREIGRLEDMHRIERPTTAELLQMGAALGVTAGHWYKCSKGHLYVIGECGQSMEKGAVAPPYNGKNSRGEKVTGRKLMSLPRAINPERQGRVFPSSSQDLHSFHVTDHHTGREVSLPPYSSETV